MPNNEKHDKLFNEPLGQITDFTFDDKVAEVFPDMIKRSVPGYKTIIAMTGVIAERYATDNSNCYDLGCSLGASTVAIGQKVSANGCKIIAVDNSPSMLTRCREVIALDGCKARVKFVEADIEDIAISNASVVVLNFTLQFLPPERRQTLIDKIYKGMCSEAVLILSEKVCFEDPHLQELNTELHHEFKRTNGYSELEIAQKRTAIENVLLPETITTHRKRIMQSGFSSCDVWFQCFNFASMVAVK